MNELQASIFPSLQSRGGRAVKKWPRSEKGADGVVARKLRFAMRFETCRVSDHPVCGAFGGFATFIDAAATPPWQGGENVG